MDKKARSKPMSKILKRLDATTFKFVFFGDDVILHDPVESWPVYDVLIAFYSNEYRLKKAERYVTLRQPYLLNDLKMQRTLMDRRVGGERDRRAEARFPEQGRLRLQGHEGRSQEGGGG